jgi:hypothetical protein
VGTTRITVGFAHEGAYTIDLTTDAAVLLARLERAASRPRSAPSSAEELQQGFDVLCDVVTHHLSLEFDGEPSTPRATCVVDRAAAPPSDGIQALGVTVTLAGAVRDGAATFRWRYDLTFAAYALSLRVGPSEAGPTQWLEGGETSAALPVRRLAAPPPRWRVFSAGFRAGFARVVPHGVAQILFLVGLFLFNGRTWLVLPQYGAFGTAQTMVIAWSAWHGVDVPSGLVRPAIGLSLAHMCIGTVAAWSRRGWWALLPAWGLAHGASLSAALHGSGMSLPPGPASVSGFAAGAVVSQLTMLLGARLVVGGTWCPPRTLQRNNLANQAIASRTWPFRRRSSCSGPPTQMRQRTINTITGPAKSAVSASAPDVRMSPHLLPPAANFPSSGA